MLWGSHTPPPPQKKEPHIFSSSPTLHPRRHPKKNSKSFKWIKVSLTKSWVGCFVYIFIGRKPNFNLQKNPERIVSLILKRSKSTYPPILKRPKSRNPTILMRPKSIFMKIEIFVFFESEDQNLIFNFKKT